MEIAQGIIGLAVLLCLLLSGGDVRKLGTILGHLFAALVVLFGVALATVIVAVLGLGAAWLLVGFVLLLCRMRKAPDSPKVSQSPETQPRIYAAISSASPPESFAPPPPLEFSGELMHKLEWWRFERLVQRIFQAQGFSASRTGRGGDGGVDLILREQEDGPITGFVQCKAWTTWTVPPEKIRALYGAMAAENVQRGYFVISGKYSKAALEWAQNKNLTLVDGRELVGWLNDLPLGIRNEIYSEAFTGDFETPLCPKCEIPMTRRTGPYGVFWGCPNYSRQRPPCLNKIKISKTSG